MFWRMGQLLACDRNLSARFVSTVDISETVKESRGLTANRTRRIKSVKLLRDGSLKIQYRD